METINLDISQKEFWDKISFTKHFNDPFYLETFKQYLNTNSFIIEYGCGYGRILDLFWKTGFKNLKGFDFSDKMIERGRREKPYLSLELIKHAKLPLLDNSINAAILSTVLCCVPDKNSQLQIINEIKRVLKPKGLIYICDFLITDSKKFQEKYQEGFSIYNEWGIYKTSENAIVKHFKEQDIDELMCGFHKTWYHVQDFVTMNGNAVKTFHSIYSMC